VRSERHNQNYCKCAEEGPPPRIVVITGVSGVSGAGRRISHATAFTHVQVTTRVRPMVAAPAHAARPAAVMTIFAAQAGARCVSVSVSISLCHRLADHHAANDNGTTEDEARDAGGTKVAHSDGAGTSAIVDRRGDTCPGGALEAFVNEKAAAAAPLLSSVRHYTHTHNARWTSRGSSQGHRASVMRGCGASLASRLSLCSRDCGAWPRIERAPPTLQRPPTTGISIRYTV
jgi:hypothetical protein